MNRKKYYFLRAMKKMRVGVWHNFWLKLISLIISIILWLFVSGIMEEITKKVIKV